MCKEALLASPSLLFKSFGWLLCSLFLEASRGSEFSI